MSKRKTPPDKSAAIDIDGQKQVFVSPRFARGGGLSYLNSPLLELIDSIYETYPRRAQELLRQHVEVNYELSEFEHGLVKVAAKRTREAEIAIERNFGSRRAAIQWVREQVQAIIGQNTKLDAAKFERPRAIVCALFSHKHELLVVESNQNAQIKTEHAELRLLKRLREARLEKGSYYVITSLQSCRMCAGALKEWLVFQNHGRPGSIKIEIMFLEKEKNLEFAQTTLSGFEFHCTESGERN